MVCPDSELTTGAIFLQLAFLVHKQLDIETEETGEADVTDCGHCARAGWL